MSVYCHSCYATEQKYYIYHSINGGSANSLSDISSENRGNDFAGETIYCPKCARKERRPPCIMCGKLLGKDMYLSFNFVVRRRCANIGRVNTRGQLCQNCITLCTSSILIDKVVNPGYELGVYCGHCHQKKAKYKKFHYVSQAKAYSLDMIYKRAIDTTTIPATNHWEAGRRRRARNQFKLQNRHPWGKCKKIIKCKKKNCARNGFIERSGYCRLHMPPRKIKKEILNTVNKYMCADMAGLITTYVV